MSFLVKGGNPTPEMGDPSELLRGDPGFFFEGDPEEGDPFLLPLLGLAAKFLLPTIAPAVVGWVGEKLSGVLGGAVSTVSEALMPSSTGTMDPITQLAGEQELAEEEEDDEEGREILARAQARMRDER